MKNLLRNILSVSNNNIHKVVIILGIKLKFKSKKLIYRQNLLEAEQKYNNINQSYNKLSQEHSKLQQSYNSLQSEFEEYKQQQIIDKSEADNIRGEVYKYPVNMDVDEPRVHSINWINKDSKILDVGCACGDFGKKLKELKNTEIIGLEYNSASIEVAKSLNVYKDIIQCDLNKYKNIPLQDEKFDYIVCNDVLEHVYEPQKVINHLKQHLKDDGYFILSIPNIAHASIKANLLLNNFDYTPTGLLDQTHIRFFTHKTVVRFLSDLNLEIEECKLTHYFGINGLQPNNPYPDLPQNIREFILKDKHSSIVQYVVKCKNSIADDLVSINTKKIQSQLEKTSYMSGVEEYINV